MADWTTIPNSNLEPDAPARSIDALALRDNPIAIAEGAVGAPRVEESAIANNLRSYISRASASIVIQPRERTQDPITSYVDLTGAINADEIYIFNRIGTDRGPWNYPRLNSEVTVGDEPGLAVAATYYNDTPVSVSIRLAAQVYRFGDDSCDLRLVYNNAVGSAVAVTGTGLQTVLMPPITVAPNTFMVIGIQGRLGAGSGADQLCFRALANAGVD